MTLSSPKSGGNQEREGWLTGLPLLGPEAAWGQLLSSIHSFTHPIPPPSIHPSIHSLILSHFLPFIHSFIYSCHPLCFILSIPSSFIPFIPCTPLAQVFTPSHLFIELNPYFQFLLCACDVAGTGAQWDCCAAASLATGAEGGTWLSCSDVWAVCVGVCIHLSQDREGLPLEA